MKEDRRGEDDAVQAIEHASMALDHAAPVLDAAIALAAARGRTNPRPRNLSPAIEESPPAPLADQSSAIEAATSKACRREVVDGNRNHREAESCVERSPAKSRVAFRSPPPRDFGKPGSAISNRSQAFRTRSLWGAEPVGAENERSLRETGRERRSAPPELPRTQTKFATVPRQPRVLAPEIAKDGKTAQSSDWLVELRGFELTAIAACRRVRRRRPRSRARADGARWIIAPCASSRYYVSLAGGETRPTSLSGFALMRPGRTLGSFGRRRGAMSRALRAPGR